MTYPRLVPEVKTRAHCTTHSHALPDDTHMCPQLVGCRSHAQAFFQKITCVNLMTEHQRSKRHIFPVGNDVLKSPCTIPRNPEREYVMKSSLEGVLLNRNTAGGEMMKDIINLTPALIVHVFAVIRPVRLQSVLYTIPFSELALQRVVKLNYSVFTRSCIGTRLQ